VYSSELVNTVGNSASRVTAMVEKYFDGALPSETDAQEQRIVAAAGGVDWPARAAAAAAITTEGYESLELSSAARAAIRLVVDVDVFIQATEPFRLAKDADRRAELGAILYQCLEAIRIAGVLLAPVMPVKMAELALALAGGDEAAAAQAAAVPTAERVKWGGLRPGTRVAKLALFPRVEPPDAPPAAAVAPTPAKKGAKLPKGTKPAPPKPAAPA
jgi:methionyl-tRNA synthetase